MENYAKFEFISDKGITTNLKLLYDGAQEMAVGDKERWLKDIDTYYKSNITSMENDGTYNNYGNLKSKSPYAELNLASSSKLDDVTTEEYVPRYNTSYYENWFFKKDKLYFTLHNIEMIVKDDPHELQDLHEYVEENVLKYDKREPHGSFKTYGYTKKPSAKTKSKLEDPTKTKVTLMSIKDLEKLQFPTTEKANNDHTEIYFKGLIKKSDIVMLEAFKVILDDNYSFNTADYSKFCDKMLLSINVDFLNFLKESKFEGFDPRELFKMIVSRQNKDLTMEQISSDMLKAVGLCLLRGPNIDSIERRSNAATKKFVQDLKVRYNLRTRGKDNKDPTMMRLISTFPYLSQVVHIYMMDNDLDRYVTLEDIPSILKPILHPGLISLVDVSTQVGLLMAIVYTIYQVGVTIKVTKKPKSFSETFKETIPYILAALNGSIVTKGQRTKFIILLKAINFLSSDSLFSSEVAKAISELLNKKLRNLGLYGIQDVNNILSKYIDGSSPELSLLGDIKNTNSLNIKSIVIIDFISEDEDFFDY